MYFTFRRKFVFYSRPVYLIAFSLALCPRLVYFPSRRHNFSIPFWLLPAPSSRFYYRPPVSLIPSHYPSYFGRFSLTVLLHLKRQTPFRPNQEVPSCALFVNSQKCKCGPLFCFTCPVPSKMSSGLTKKNIFSFSFPIPSRLKNSPSFLPVPYCSTFFPVKLENCSSVKPVLNFANSRDILLY